MTKNHSQLELRWNRNEAEDAPVRRGSGALLVSKTLPGAAVTLTVAVTGAVRVLVGAIV